MSSDLELAQELVNDLIKASKNYSGQIADWQSELELLKSYLDTVHDVYEKEE